MLKVKARAKHRQEGSGELILQKSSPWDELLEFHVLKKLDFTAGGMLRGKAVRDRVTQFEAKQ